MHHWMFNCKEVTRMVSESLDRELPLLQRIGIRIHLLMCKFCSRYRKKLLILREVIHLYTTHNENIESSIALPLEAKERIKRAMSLD
jgi:hypothetical protein